MKKIALLALAALLGGCATMDGVEPMTDAERAECARTRQCAVWTEAQIQELVRKAMVAGARMGVQSCRREGSRSL